MSARPTPVPRARQAQLRLDHRRHQAEHLAAALGEPDAARGIRDHGREDRLEPRVVREVCIAERHEERADRLAILDQGATHDDVGHP
jgi:hypothetical protein